jgi:hypothetical protein
VWGILRPEVGDGYGWWGIFPIVGMGMGKSYPMGMYPLPSLGAPSRSVESRGVSQFLPLFFSVFAFFLTPVPSHSAYWWQELERRARERYAVLDRLDADYRWYRGQYEALEALVEAHRSPDRWLAYRAEALLDSPPEQGAQTAEGASAVVRLRTVLVERDDALRRALEDLENVRSLTSTWEVEVATARAPSRRRAEGLKTALADKTAALATAEEQLRQERAARQEAEGQLQRERAALVEARAALEQEQMAREEALGQLQQERAALEEVQATLQKKEEEVSRLDGELVQLSISHEDQRQSLEEQEASYLKLQREAEETGMSLEAEKKQIEGEFVSFSIFVRRFVLLGSTPNFISFLSVASRPADRAGVRDHPGRDAAGGLQLLSTRVGGAAGRRPRDLPGGRGRRGAVTEPPKIIPYYRLSRSTWPLSNNKELISRFRRVKPGKSHTTGSLICAKLTRRRDQSTTLHYIKGSQVQDYYKPDFSYIKVNMVQSLNSEK